jgi:serine/threonine protein kinase
VSGGAGGARPLPSIPGFALERALGAGAHGAVYLAREEGGLARRCALKVFEPWARERWEHEVQMCGRVEEMRRRSRAPEIVQPLAVGEAPGPGGTITWIALEWAEAGSLADRVARDGPLPWEAALPLAREAARALALLHAEGLFHRDVKPANLLQGADGRLRLADFGLARPLAGTLSAAGSPAFAAPEVIAGRVEDGRRADVYSLGATLAWLVTGETMLPGRPDVFALERRGVPRGAQRAIAAAMAADPVERTGDMETLLSMLEGVAENREIPRGSTPGRDGDVQGATGAPAKHAEPLRSPTPMPAATLPGAAAPAASNASALPSALTAPPRTARSAILSLLCAIGVLPSLVVLVAVAMFLARGERASVERARAMDASPGPRASQAGPVRTSTPREVDRGAPAGGGAPATTPEAASSSGAGPRDSSTAPAEAAARRSTPDSSASEDPDDFLRTSVSYDGGRTFQEIPSDREPEPISSGSGALIFGAIVLGVPLVLELSAVVLGLLALSWIGSSGGALTGRGFAIAGLIIAALNATCIVPAGFFALLAGRPVGPG